MIDYPSESRAVYILTVRSLAAMQCSLLLIYGPPSSGLHRARHIDNREHREPREQRENFLTFFP